MHNLNKLIWTITLAYKITKSCIFGEKNENYVNVF